MLLAPPPSLNLSFNLFFLFLFHFLFHILLTSIFLYLSLLVPLCRVLLVYPPSLNFIIAFLGCLKAGLIAVPTFPPDPKRLNKDLKMFACVADSCSATAALTSAQYDYAAKLGTLQNAFTNRYYCSSW